MERVIHPTTALCPRCDQVVTANVVEKSSDVWLQGTCAAHGPFEGLYFRDAAFYETLRAVRNTISCCATYDCAQGQPCSRRAVGTMIYIMNLTNNCNMTCDACLSGSRIGRDEPYSSAQRLMAPLPNARDLPITPHLFLMGGEPTMHPQLEDIVRDSVARGYIPRLATNGLKLCDEGYARRLAAAGLKWVCLHFDSVDDQRNRQLRGRPMVDASSEAIRSAQAAGMKVQFLTTVYRDTLGELKEILDFAHQHGVFWITMYPVADIGRAGSQGQTYLADAVDALASQSGGTITRHDFVAVAKLLSRLHRVTGRIHFRQKPTMVTLPLIASGRDWVPALRLLGSGALGRPQAAWRLLRSMPSLIDYERREPSPDTMVVCIHQFQSRHVFDLEEGVQTLNSYTKEEGSFIPFDVFNHMHRQQRPPKMALTPV